MNLALRNEIIYERNRHQHDGNSFNDTLLFFDKLSQLLGFRVDSFQQVIEIFANLKENNGNIIESFCSSKTGKKNKSTLNSQSLHSQLNDANSRINSLKCELSRANSVIYKQKNAIRELKSNNNEYKNLIKEEIKDANSYQKNQIQNDQYIFKLESKNQKLKNTITSLQNEIKSLKEQFETTSYDFSDEEKDLNANKHLKADCTNSQLDYDKIEKLIYKIQKLRMKVDFYKQKATEFRSENEKLQHQLKIKTECHWSNNSIRDAFRNIQDILGLDPDASPCDTYSAVSSLICHLHNCM